MEMNKGDQQARRCRRASADPVRSQTLLKFLTQQRVEHPPTEKPVLKVETPEPNKYAPKPKIGSPTLGRSPNYVESVGLGKNSK